MKQEIFFEELNRELSGMREEERKELTAYYNELLLDGLELGKEEEEIIRSFGEPSQIAKELGKHTRDFQNIKKEKTESKGYHTEPPFHTIRIDVQDIRMEVFPVKSKTVRVLYDVHSEIDKVEVTTENGEFCYRHRHKNIFSGWMQLFVGARKMQVEIPEDFDGNLEIRTRNSKIIAGELKHLTNARFQTSNAPIILEEMKVESLSVQSSNGALHLNRLDGGQMEAITANGQIEARKVSFENALLLQTANSGIRIESIESEKVVLRTSNASVTGTLKGKPEEYSITAHTSNNFNNLQDVKRSNTKKHLAVNTSNGKIQINFV